MWLSVLPFAFPSSILCSIEVLIYIKKIDLIKIWLLFKALKCGFIFASYHWYKTSRKTSILHRSRRFAGNCAFLILWKGYSSVNNCLNSISTEIWFFNCDKNCQFCLGFLGSQKSDWIVRLYALHSSVCYADKEASRALFLARKSKRFPEKAYVVHFEEWRCECWTDLSCLESGGSPEV